MKSNKKQMLGYLLQISSPSFPIGAFNHSYGLEEMIVSDIVKNTSEMKDFLRFLLRGSLGNIDAPIVKLSAECQDFEMLKELDIVATALKPAAELRVASQKTGKAFMKLYAKMFSNTKLVSWIQNKDNLSLNYSVAFGAVCKELGIDVDAAVLAFLSNAVSSYIQVAAKLIPISQIDGQIIFAELNEDICQTAERAIGINNVSELSAFNPMADIAAMRHENLAARLYMS